MANGIADDMLTSVALAIRGIPRCLAPAMNTAMYENPIVQDNLNRLLGYGFEIIEPREARLACGDLGKGAMAGADVIVRTVEERLESKR